LKGFTKILSNYKLILGVGLIAILYFFYDEIKNLFKSESTNDDEVLLFDDMQSVLEDSANIDTIDAEVIANQLENAMSSDSLGGLSAWGTNFQSIDLLLDPSYNADARSLIYATFGVRPYDGAGTPTYLSSFFATDKDLGQWFYEELSGDELQQVKDYFSISAFTI
jgi:hypothetical protein